MVKLFAKIIAARREHPEEKHNDVLEVFMTTAYRDGSYLTDDQVGGSVVGNFENARKSRGDAKSVAMSLAGLVLTRFPFALPWLCQITGLMIALLFAGQHTSSITSSWTGLLMLSNPQFVQVCCALRCWVGWLAARVGVAVT